MNEINDLVEMSKYAGERFDLVQAGGGNSSVKYSNDEMIIKASGFLLSDVEVNNGYSKVITSKIANIVNDKNILETKEKRQREELSSVLVKQATLDEKNRPSIETLLHSFLLKYTLHTHPLVVNMITIQKKWQKILKKVFKKDTIAFVEYQTPGIELALSLHKELQKFDKIPNIIFLQNHGLIVTSQNKQNIKIITEHVLKKIEKFLKIDTKVYKITNNITSLLNNIEKNTNISYLSQDNYLNEMIKKQKNLFFNTPFCPDSLVYCGISTCKINDLQDMRNIKEYENQYFEMPKVIIYKNNLFFIAPNIKKAKEMEEVFKFHIMVLVQNIKNEKNFLKFEELAYLSNWEAEKYRQKK